MHNAPRGSANCLDQSYRYFSTLLILYISYKEMFADERSQFPKSLTSEEIIISMGTFIGHIVPGLALALLGLWHAINTIKSYLANGPGKFVVRFWYRDLELISILSFSILAMLMQVLDFSSFHFAFKLDNLEHATMFIHLALFAGFTLYTDLTDSFEILSGFVGILASSVFGQEYFLLHFHSTDHVGLEGHYHWLLQLIVLVSLVAAVVAAASPNNFIAALILSISVAFQGCWFINMGFMLWDPAFIPEGCVMNLSKAGGNGMLGAVTCGSDEADFRARALANLQFSWILAAILTFIALVCLKLARKSSITDRLTEYKRLHGKGSDSPVTTEDVKQTNP